jgi:hypothetical protein
MTTCCANGEANTELMRVQQAELQEPPRELLHLVNHPDSKTREEFLSHTMTLNNAYGFASVHSEKAPAEQMGGRMDLCKYNGKLLINIYLHI